MKLQTQLFIITDSKERNINVEDRNIIVALNGERLPTRLQDIFSALEFDAGEIYGNSLLSYYHINEDGSMEVEGSKVQLMDAETDELIKVKKIKRPTVHDDSNISFENIQKFAEYFKIAKPDEVFYNLNDTEKQLFISDRTTKETAIQNSASEAAASQAAAEALKAAEAKLANEQAETTLRASIDPSYVQDNKAYLATQSFYAALDGFKEYISDKHHLFYGEDPNHSFCLLIKRGANWWEEIREEKADIMGKNEQEVIIDFFDGEVPQRLRLDLESGQIEIITAKANEATE